MNLDTQNKLNRCIKCRTGTMRAIRETLKMNHVLLGQFNEVLAKCDNCDATRYFARRPK